MKIYHYGQVCIIDKGAYSPNTKYSLQVTLTHSKSSRLTATSKTEFSLLAIPTVGYIDRTPQNGRVGEKFTISLVDFFSENLPMTYDVYNTLDADGNKRGIKINKDGPIPIDEPFTYVATRVNPILIEVTDKSGEKLEIVYARKTNPSLEADQPASASSTESEPGSSTSSQDPQENLDNSAEP